MIKAIKMDRIMNGLYPFKIGNLIFPQKYISIYPDSLSFIEKKLKLSFRIYKQTDPSTVFIRVLDKPCILVILRVMIRSACTKPPG